MNKFTSISVEGMNWIIDHLRNGRSSDSLIHAMVKDNFDQAAASQIVSRLAGIMKANTEIGSLRDDFIYETPRFPQRGPTIHTSDRDIHVTVRINKPVIAVLDQLLSNEECDELVEIAKKRVTRSTVVDPDTGKATIDKARTSYSTSLKNNESEFIRTLNQRITEVMRYPIEHGEDLHIINYQAGAEYKPHFDYFPKINAGSELHLGKGGQRVSTLIMYLNDVESGGETIFPKLGLSILPKKGSAVYFEYCNSLEQVDSMTLHGGAPVVLGEKWIATKWMRQSRRY
ncbi:2OG-Fe(II) oxygenase [Paenibacillus dakarensis]|uniref:2OG-Fe(II) oxygenase n=1 Tax=Paenibacillus dakarensis TaxID=1527293 RepID=UPI0006D5342F|nr:2OG-Fe(II) oxygenase [Paenibacillus dakarensis]